MNTEHRNKVLVGFGALAVVVIAAIALWPPSFRSEEASGAIGAVQKHHAPQIAQKDVILGDEATRREQKVLWSDFLNDASKIQTLSAAMVSNAQNANIANNFGELSNELRHQFADEMAAALAEVQMEANKAGNKGLLAQAGELAGKVASAPEMSSAQMQEYSKMFASIEASANKTSDKSVLELADADLAAAISHLKDADLAMGKLRAAEDQLRSLDLNDIEVADQVEYFTAIEAASAVVEQAESASHTASKFSYAAEMLAKTANKLEVAALNSMEEQSAASIQAAHILSQMEAKIAANKGAGSAAVDNNLTALNQLLASKSDQFRSQTAAAFSMEVAEIGSFAANQQQAAKLTGSAEAGSKVVYALLMNEAPLQNALVKLDAALHNGDMANLLSNEDSMISSIGELESKLASKGQ